MGGEHVDADGPAQPPSPMSANMFRASRAPTGVEATRAEKDTKTPEPRRKQERAQSPVSIPYVIGGAIGGGFGDQYAKSSDAMISARSVFLFALPVVLGAVVPALAFDVRAPYVRPATEIERRVYFTPATPLDQIPLYSLDPASPDAMRGLEAELARLYTHTTSLPSGPDRRAFQTRIYHLEKRLRPLEKAFDAQIWSEVRTAVRQEWEAVQASLPSASVSAPVANATRAVDKTDRS